MGNSEYKELKEAVIREEYVALTGHWISAVMLNQFLYWGKRTNDTDKYIIEEQERDENVNIELTHGWIWKKADELADEIMIKMSTSTARKYIKELTDAGWLDVRRNPKHKWDKTLQYRPNIRKIDRDLKKIGYRLQGWKKVTSILDNDHRSSVDEPRTSDNETAVPETITETTALKTRDNSKTEETKTDAEEYFDVREEVINEKKPRTTEEYQESIRETLLRVGDKVDSMSTEELAIASYVANIPDNMRGLAEAFCGVFGRPPAKGEDGFWRKGWNEQYEIGLKPVYVQRAYKKMMEEGLTVKSPGSVTAIADQLQREDKESTQDGTYFGANEVWDSEGKVYG